MREAIAACDDKLGELAARVECEVTGQLPEAPKGQRNVGKTTAAAHKLARIVHGMIKSQKPYDEKEAFKLTPQSEARRREALEKQAAALCLIRQSAAA